MRKIKAQCSFLGVGKKNSYGRLVHKNHTIRSFIKQCYDQLDYNSCRVIISVEKGETGKEVAYFRYVVSATNEGKV